MKHSKPIEYFKWLFALTAFLLSGCLLGNFIQAPVRQVPDKSQIPFEVIKQSENIRKGSTYECVIKTTPKNLCFGAIVYPAVNTMDSVDLPNLIADENGLCTWSWVVPENAERGEAAVRGHIEQNGESTYFAPILFCIEGCP